MVPDDPKNDERPVRGGVEADPISKAPASGRSVLTDDPRVLPASPSYRASDPLSEQYGTTHNARRRTKYR